MVIHDNAEFRVKGNWDGQRFYIDSWKFVRGSSLSEPTEDQLADLANAAASEDELESAHYMAELYRRGINGDY